VTKHDSVKEHFQDSPWGIECTHGPHCSSRGACSMQHSWHKNEVLLVDC